MRKTVGTKSNRDGLGAVVRVASAGGKQWAIVHSGSSYCSQSELALTFGLGRDTKARLWKWSGPAARSSASPISPADRLVTVEEGKGIE